MAVKNYDDLDFGDETRGEALQTVGLPHGAAEDGSGGPDEGMAVTVDGGNIVAATQGDNVVGVLYTYQYFGDSSRDGPYVRTDRDATVAVGGKFKAYVGSGVVAGDALAPDDDGAGVLGPAGDASSNLVALSDAKEQDEDHYAEVLVR